MSPPRSQLSLFAPAQAATRAALVAVCLAAVAACGGMGGGGEVVPRPGLIYGAPVALDGLEVMVLPVQMETGVPAGADPDAELAFALEQRGPDVSWVLPADLRRVTGRNPGIEAPLEGLPVAVFLQAQVERIGDPLYGHLRRLGGLTGASVALIPVRVRYRSEPLTVEERVFEPAVEITAALVHVRSGRVLWYAILDGANGGPDDPRTLATAADVLARTLIP